MTSNEHSPPAAAPAALPRPASTLVLLRDGAQGVEVLLLRRAERAGDRSSGAWVFPGGTLDAADRGWSAAEAGLDDAAASARLGVESGGLAYCVAAIRECLEECGVLLAAPVAGAGAVPAGTVAALQAALRRGEADLRTLCRQSGLRLDAPGLAYHSHWLTPPGLPRRFDTRFFVAAMPPGQQAAPDGAEMLEHVWLRPADALERADAMRLPNPTRRTLEAIAGFVSVETGLAQVRALREIRLTMPRMADGPRGPRPVHPDEPCYAEIARIDPQGRGHARYALEPGRVVRLSQRVWRVTAPNGSAMTGPGTNTYLLAAGPGQDCAVIDPGPADEAHVEAILAAAPGPVRRIFVTHTHRDHSPAAQSLKARTGAELLGMAALHEEWQDLGFVPERPLRHGDRVPLGEGATLRVLHTPGHAANHLCYLLEEERTLFTGDHVMQGSTVVISPPDGDMGAYLASLEALLGEALDWLAPGHGFLIAEPERALRRLIRHRRTREAKVLRVLEELGGGALDALLPRVYDDVPPALHPVARRSLAAHLLWLEAQGRALQRGPDWFAARG
ncbi:MBL fold metallo-hydrolase [Caldimonas tepidiphila]|uniref:MBL fold metallo-hydrolase n=1 Tax=Caldimonas tepidiphila TaxID=2315841 RepID=UPI000E5A20A9|nr:MBL fold metallo-hydrolase [Caldimonas tepidiphila]